MIRKATESDIPGVSALYDDIHTEEESGRAVIGWERGVYPTENTARKALADGELFVVEEDGKIIGAAIINQRQVDVYAGAPWSFAASDDEVMVLHTLVISPRTAAKVMEGDSCSSMRTMLSPMVADIFVWIPMNAIAARVPCT